MPFRIASKLHSKAEGSYVREAYRNGLEIAAGGVLNPYKFGLIGSTDTHLGGGADREDDLLLEGRADGRHARAARLGARRFAARASWPAPWRRIW